MYISSQSCGPSGHRIKTPFLEEDLNEIKFLELNSQVKYRPMHLPTFLSSPQIGQSTSDYYIHWKDALYPCRPLSHENSELKQLTCNLIINGWHTTQVLHRLYTE